jgi:hypothetical protein
VYETNVVFEECLQQTRNTSFHHNPSKPLAV